MPKLYPDDKQLVTDNQPLDGSCPNRLLPCCRLFNASAERVMWRLRSRLFEHIIHQEVGFFDRCAHRRAHEPAQ